MRLSKLIRQVHEGSRDPSFKGMMVSPPKGGIQCMSWTAMSTTAELKDRRRIRAGVVLVPSSKHCGHGACELVSKSIYRRLAPLVGHALQDEVAELQKAFNEWREGVRGGSLANKRDEQGVSAARDIHKQWQSYSGRPPLARLKPRVLRPGEESYGGGEREDG